jgi:hypothetical protein
MNEMTTASENVCCSPGCAAPTAGNSADVNAPGANAPVPLCDRHLALAAEWAARRFGVEDLLPSPCLACGSRLGVLYPSGWMCAVCEWVYGTVPDAELPHSRVEVVYYIRFRDRIKIGTTGNLGQRMRTLWHDEIMALERGGRTRERVRHEQFAADRIGGEWFRISPALTAHVDQLRAGVDDPWELYALWVSEAIALRA